jgi:hypothetical protein
MSLPLQVCTVIAVLALAGCEGRGTSEPAPYLPLAEVEGTYGALITAGNHPTPDQNGTGERLGLFQDPDGEVWGLPLTVATNGVIRACAPPLVRHAQVTDTFPAGSIVIGSTNEPTGWRGGTGDLELLLRDAHGTIRWQAVNGAPLATGPACWAPESPGPPLQLHYYRLAPLGAAVR